MKPKKNNTDELVKLFDVLNIDSKVANEIRCDLQAGDALLSRQREPDCPDELIERITRDINNRTQRLSWPMRLRHIAAVLVLGFVLVGLFELTRQPFGNSSLDHQTILIADEFDVLETALDLELEELEVVFDDPVVAEILSLWDDANWDIQQLFGKEFTDETEPFSFGYGFNDWMA